MNHVIQIWKLKNLDTVEESTVKTRIKRLLEKADKLGKFTRDMKKPEFIATQQAKYDVVFDIGATPIKTPVPSTHQSKSQVDSSDEKAKQKRPQVYDRKCVVCGAKGTKGFHTFPTIKAQQQKWLNQCNIESIKENDRIFFRHFKSDDYFPRRSDDQLKILKKKIYCAFTKFTKGKLENILLCM